MMRSRLWRGREGGLNQQCLGIAVVGGWGL